MGGCEFLLSVALLEPRQMVTRAKEPNSVQEMAGTMGGSQATAVSRGDGQPSNLRKGCREQGVRASS